GPTDYDNLVTLCTRHHHHCHEGGWKVTGDPCAEITFTSPDATIAVTSHPAIRRPPPRRRRRPPPSRGDTDSDHAPAA
ncbi:MAG: hypothetical protein ACYDH6_20715, partial [Acidimicrobiales bacterium]